MDHHDDSEDGGSTGSNHHLANNNETDAIIQAEMEALEYSALTFGQHHAIVITAKTTLTDTPPPPQDEIEDDSIIPMRLSRRHRRRRPSPMGCEDDRLSAFDVLVVFPFYITCGIMAVLAVNGAFWNSASTASASAAFPLSAHGNSRRWLQQPNRLESSPRDSMDITSEEFRLDHGIQLALHHGMDDLQSSPNVRVRQTAPSNKEEQPFELYQEWDLLASHVHGSESWRDLLRLHKQLLDDSPTGTFYHNRDAVKERLGVP
jgi:hypothetical protein